MTWNDETRQFVASHINDDTSRLLLSAHRYPGIDVPFAVEQIEARRRLRTKLPEWYANDQLIMSGRVPAEQCSSEQTARFKRTMMLGDARSLCDMTGGMGVDFWYMSQGLDRAVYTERQPLLCQTACHNFESLQSQSTDTAMGTVIVIREGVSTQLPIPDVDVIYLDPARRSEDGSRIYEISDCEPDVVSWQDELLLHCRQLITKLSPMADLSRSLSRLKHVTDVYVLSVRNECKELLFSQYQGTSVPSVPKCDVENGECMVHCIDFCTNRTIEFSYYIGDAQKAPAAALATTIGRYFYEPDVSVMKCQAFNLLSQIYEMPMLDTDCHYFSSDTLSVNFPGRIFVVDEVMEFSSKGLKRLRSIVPQANIASRGFPLSSDQLRQRTGIRDGGDVYLFGAMLHENGAVLIRCHKYSDQ